MARFKVRHLHQNASGFYFKTTPAMRQAGMVSEALGQDIGPAIERAEQLNALWDEIRAARRAGQDAPGAAAPRRGSLDWVVAELQKSREWHDKAPRTREEIERALGVLQPVFGPSAMGAVTPDQAIRFYDRMLAAGSLHKAALVMKWWRYLYSYAMRRWPRVIAQNPTLAVKIRHPKARRQVWEAAQVRAAIRRAWRRKWYGVAAAIALAYDTGLRPSDLREVTGRQLGADRVTLTPAKTAHLAGRDSERPFPVWPETIALVERYKARLGLIIPADQPLLRSVSGRPFASRHHLAKQIRIVCREAGIPDSLQLRDLRRTGNVEAAIGGASAPQLAARADHSIGRGQAILDTYTPASFAAAQAAQAARRKDRKE